MLSPDGGYNVPGNRADSFSNLLAKLTEPLSSETAFAVEHIFPNDPGVHFTLPILDFSHLHHFPENLLLD